MEQENNQQPKTLTLSEFRHEVGIPLLLARKLVLWGEIGAVKAMDGTIRIAETEVAVAKRLMTTPWKKAALFVRMLGPGLITGASDDDPSGIGTYSSVGAKFGLGIIWTAAWLFPVMLAIQEVCARIGIVTNRGLAGVIKGQYKKRIVYSVVFLLVVANVINIGVDLGAMAESLAMLVGINFYFAALAFALISIIFEVFIGYHLYIKFLKWLSLSVLAYVAAGIIIHPDWLAVSKSMFVPVVRLEKEYIFALIAIFGTTITPYLFFWQASGEVEENKLAYSVLYPRKVVGRKLKARIGRMRTDVFTGMFLANVVFFFIVLTTSHALFGNGITEIGTAKEAAEALKPLAGRYAYLLFALGIIGTGMLAIPVLAGSGAYAMAEIMEWEEGLDLKFSRAKGFYLVIVFSVLIGLSLNLFHVNPITALYWDAFINGIISIPLLIVIMLVGNNKKIMGRETHPGWVKIFGWAAVAIMILAVCVFIFM
ncbi:MAG: divalent metal cation transporter [Candidatus Moranbacteria bacterium]|nr:divalent metal cation transporter [Candidatus Moranbacteria bacterium]